MKVTSRKTRREVHVTHVGEIRKAYKILVGNPDTESSLRIPKSRYKDDFEVDLRGYVVAICRMF
jgi:hypothetical protein